MPGAVKCRWFKPARPGGAGSRTWVDDFPPFEISGVYAIADLDGQVLYVGESHTGRLRKTLARHFQTWNDPRDFRQVYDRHRVQVCWLETPDDEALDAEAEWMLALDPRDNLAAPLDARYPAKAKSDFDDAGLEYAGAADDDVPF